MALLDEIKKRLSGGANQPAAPAGLGAQTGAQKILGTKATGKAPVGGAMASGIQQKVAEQQAGQQMAEVQEQGQAAAQQIGQEQEQTQQSLESAKQDLEAKRQDAEQKQAAQFQMGENARLAQQDEAMAKLDAREQMTIAQTSARYDQTLKQLTSDRGIAEDDIFEQFRQGNEELADREDAANLEQLAFTLRLRDTQYIDHITRVAKLNNLEDELAFRKEAASLRMGEETALMMDQFGFLEQYDQDARAFSEKMMSMDIDNALALSDAMAKDAAKSQMISGVVSGASAVAGMDWGSGEGTGVSANESSTNTNTSAKGYGGGATR